MSRARARLLIASVAFVHAALFIAYQQPDWYTQWTDQNGYLMLGRILAETGRYTRFASTPAYVPEPIRTPAYPAFVAALDLAFGESRLVIALAQAILFAVIGLLVYAIARTVVSDRLALVAGLVTVLYPPLPYFGALVLTELVTTVLVTAGIAVWLGALRRDSLPLFIASGVLLAATALTRPSFQALPLFLAAAAVVVPRNRRPWRGGLALVATFVVIVTPWIAYNVAYFNRLTFSPAGGPGRQLFEGTWQVELPGRLQTELTALADATPDRRDLDDKVRAVAVRSQRPAEPLLLYVHQHLDLRRIWLEPHDPSERVSARIAADGEYWRVGLDNIRRDPVRYAWRRATRGTFLLWASEIPVRYSDINRLSTLAIRAIWLPQAALMALALWGMVVLARHGAYVESLAMAALVLYVSAVHVPLYAEARYSLPAKPLVLLLATAGAAQLAGRFRPPERWNERG